MTLTEDERLDHARESRKQYKLAHPERVAESRKQYKVAHPEQRAAERKRYKAVHPEQRAAERKRYKKAHPEQRAAERKRYKKAHPEQLRAQEARRRVNAIQRHEFVGVDGEGWSIDGHHEYTMLVTSLPGQYLTPGRALTTLECLAFIAALPPAKHRHYVSFYFDYDVTMILRNLTLADPDKARKLFEPKAPWVWYHGFGIRYHPHKQFSVKRWTADDSIKPVTIHDTSGFFQSSFVVALRKFSIGSADELVTMSDMKDQRSEFTSAEAVKILEYSQSECRQLVELVGKIRDLSYAAGLNPYPYEGPGGLASRALAKYYGKRQYNAAVALMPAALKDVAARAMYGGRFETLAVGTVPGPVLEYDLKSAYPAAMTRLPCLVHGHWTHTRKNHGEWALSHITFTRQGPPIGDLPSAGVANPLPLRRGSGELCYPATGSGWYWRHEYQHDLPDWDVEIGTTWSWVPDGCDCRPFEWIHDLYAQRELMEGIAKGSGIALKLALNTLYGKIAQQKPFPGAWLNMVYASMITSMVRRQMYDLYLASPPQSVVMFATDAIFTTETGPFGLDATLAGATTGLGSLELAATYDQVTLIQPGVYFDGSSAHFKTRGIPRKIVAANADWLHECAEYGVDFTCSITQFVGMRIALARNNLAQLGEWAQNTRTIGTRPVSKRRGEELIDGIRWSRPVDNPNYTGESGYHNLTPDRAVRAREFTDMWTDDKPTDYAEG